MNLVRIHLVERFDDSDTYEEWYWRLEENYQLSDEDSEALKRAVDNEGYYDGDRGFVNGFKWTFDLDNDLVINELPDALYLRIYRFLLTKKNREEAINNILNN